MSSLPVPRSPSIRTGPSSVAWASICFCSAANGGRGADDLAVQFGAGVLQEPRQPLLLLAGRAHRDIGLAQALRHHPHELAQQLRLCGDQCLERAAVEGERLAVRARDHVRRGEVPAQQRHLAEAGARRQLGHGDDDAARRVHAHVRLAVRQHVEVPPRLALPDDELAGPGTRRVASPRRRLRSRAPTARPRRPTRAGRRRAGRRSHPTGCSRGPSGTLAVPGLWRRWCGLEPDTRHRRHGTTPHRHAALVLRK